WRTDVAIRIFAKLGAFLLSSKPYRAVVPSIFGFPRISNRTSRGDGVRFGVPVAQNFLEVDEIGLLLRVELEIADLTIGLGRGSCLGGRDSSDVLDVVEDLGRRKERRVAGRRALAEVERNL